MANETTTTSLNDVVNSTLVYPAMIVALSEKPGIAQSMCREFNGLNSKAPAFTLPTETSFWGSANDDGAGLDTEFNATEGTALSNTQFTSGVVTVTAAEYGVAAALTDTLGEDSVFDAATLLNFYMGRMLNVLTLAMDDDFLALLASLSNTVGTSGADLTIAQALAAQQGLRTRGVSVDPMRTGVYIFDNQQALDLEGAFIATSTSAAVYALSADRVLGINPGENFGLGDDRHFATFRGSRCVSTGLTDTANAAADVVGAYIVPTSAVNDANGSTTFGMIWKRLPTFETQRQAKGRSNDIVMTARAGFAELQDGAGTAIITDA